MSGRIDRYRLEALGPSRLEYLGHEGALFHGKLITSALAVSTAVKHTFAVAAGGVYPHVRIRVRATQAVQVDFYEGSSGNTGGMALTLRSHDRNLGTPDSQSILTVTNGATVTTNGTLIDSDKTMFAGDAIEVMAPNNDDYQQLEVILKAGTVYTLVITNGAVGTADIVTDVIAYNVTNP